MGRDDPPGEREATRGFDWAYLADAAKPREVTSATFSYVDAMLAGSMSDAELARVRDEILGDGDEVPGPDEAALPAATDTRPAASADSAELALAPIHALLAANDFAAALIAAEALIERDPGHTDAHHIADHCRDALADLYQRHVGDAHDVPQLAVPAETLGEHGIDRWAAYLISRFDGHSSIGELIDLTGFSRLDTLRLLFELVQRGIVRIERRPEPAPPSSGPARMLARVKLKRIR